MSNILSGIISVLFFISVIALMLNSSRIVVSLIILESMVLWMLVMFFLMSLTKFNQEMIIIMLCISVSEATVGLSIMILQLQSKSNDFLSTMFCVKFMFAKVSYYSKSSCSTNSS
uniref:NADH dehydrogenase subunit 4L n=1 Tax=Microceramus pontificus TaxID=513540 RepID=A0A343F268_9EUPU|nr:NADH dehydrogenase subunit 4L [Microceramus pontificus]ASP44438.1 NADH dehydrogenase subunit 4L [Microceramus pontificus]